MTGKINLRTVVRTCMFLGICLLYNFTAQASDKLAGKVLETMNSSGYTYVKISCDGKDQWVAVPQMLIHKGDEAEFTPGVEMGRYSSPTLGRSFENIIFSGGVKSLKRMVGAGRDSSSVNDEKLTLTKLAGSDSRNIAEIYSQKDALKGKKVVVQGKVVKLSKYSGLVWVRIIDGTGSRKRGNHKLVVTCKETTAKKGDIVKVSGVVHVEKSFGALIYEVIVEDAQVTVEAG